MKRYLKISSAHIEEVDQSSFRNLLRLAFQQGLIIQVEDWLHYREARNLTSHTYNFEVAEKVYQIILQFIHSAENLFESLKAKIILL